MKRLAALLAAAQFASASLALAGDVWVIRINALGVQRSDGSSQAWFDQVRVLNAGQVTESFRVIDASNGLVFPINDPLALSPGATLIPTDGGGEWAIPIPMAVFHLGVGDDVVVSSRLISSNCCPAIATPPPQPRFGAIPLPVYDALVPAGQPEILMDVDLPDYSSRVNLALYDGGEVEANALVETVSLCDGRIVSSTTLPVPANSIVQFPVGSPAACLSEGSGEGPTYLRITIDQPGFAVAATLANGVDANIPIGVSGPAR